MTNIKTCCIRKFVKGLQVIMESKPTPDPTELLKSEVMKMTSEGNNDFEGAMIDNGASKSPSGLSAYLRLCAFTNSVPNLKPSSRGFSVIGSGVQMSMGAVTISMPIGKDLMLTFEVD